MRWATALRDTFRVKIDTHAADPASVARALRAIAAEIEACGMPPIDAPAHAVVDGARVGRYSLVRTQWSTRVG